MADCFLTLRSLRWTVEGAIEDASSVLLGVASEALVVPRRVKSEGRSPQDPLPWVTVFAPEQMIPLLEDVGRLQAATKIQDLLT